MYIQAFIIDLPSTDIPKNIKVNVGRSSNVRDLCRCVRLDLIILIFIYSICNIKI